MGEVAKGRAGLERSCEGEGECEEMADGECQIVPASPRHATKLACYRMSMDTPMPDVPHQKFVMRLPWTVSR
jgi:hypothetical protein